MAKAVVIARATPAARSLETGTQAFGIHKIVDVFVENGLEIVIHAIGQHAMPVAILGAAPEQGHGIMLVEQCAKRPGHLGGGAKQPRIVPGKLRRDPAERAQRTHRRTT